MITSTISPILAAADDPNFVGILLLGVAVIIGVIFFVILVKFFGIWIQARTAGAPVSLLNLVFMRLRKVPPALIVNSRITAVKAGLPFTTDQLEAHYLSVISHTSCSR